MSDKNENITPITGQKVNLGDIYNNEMMNLKIVDASTGRPIEIPHIQDSIRVSGREDEISRDKSTIYTRTIPNETLGQFVLTKKEHFNARSCIEALGLYNTEYIKLPLNPDIEEELVKKYGFKIFKEEQENA